MSALSEQLMNDILFEEFCHEYGKHIRPLTAQQSMTLNAYHQEFEKLETTNENLMNSIESGIPAEQIKGRLIRNNKREETLKAILAQGAPEPEAFQPNKAKRYRQQIDGLINSLNGDEGRSAAMELIRDLIDKIVLTPTSNDKELRIDLYGDIAGILSATANREKPEILKDLSSVLQQQQNQQEVLVAGAGFEPATFRL